MTTESLQQVIDASCAQLERTAKLMGVEISYNIASVSMLEDIVHALIELADGDEKALKGGTFLVGAYLGEIVRRALGGEWVGGVDGTQFAVGTRFGEMYPIAHVRNFAAEPDKDSLVFFAEGAIALANTGEG